VHLVQNVLLRPVAMAVADLKVHFLGVFDTVGALGVPGFSRFAPWPLLSHYVASGSDPIRHDPLNVVYRVDNLLLRATAGVGGKRKERAFSGGLRRLSNERALSVRVASSAVAHFQEGGYEPANLVSFAGATGGFENLVEPVSALPEHGVDLPPLGGPAPPAGPHE
jgi:hypothetical protein